VAAGLIEHEQGAPKLRLCAIARSR